MRYTGKADNGVASLISHEFPSVSALCTVRTVLSTTHHSQSEGRMSLSEPVRTDINGLKI